MTNEDTYRLIPRIKRSTLLTLPFVDPEIRNSEIRNYFRMYGIVQKVAYEYYRDPNFANIKTGCTLVFIDLYEGHGVPPFCIVRGQKISVSYRGRRPICFHCNVEGHMKAKCPITKYKTCYNCGSPGHKHAECCEPTFVAYFFNKEKTYLPLCYPTYYKPDDPEDDTIYGLIQNIEEARDYNLTFDPYFYSPDVAEQYVCSTYKDNDKEQEQDEENNDNENYENIRGIWESDNEDTTEPTETDEHMKTDSKGKTPSQQTKTANKTEKSGSKPKQKTQPNPSKSTPTQTPKTSDSGASNQNQDLPPPTKLNSPQVTEINRNDPQTATKRKLQTNSPKVEQKKTKDTSATNKDSTNQEHMVVINGKACMPATVQNTC